jgi:DNA (cytosine-5)-methyltransferase 1
MEDSGQKIKIATVCSGIGSPEQALKELDIPHEISFACEIDKYARQTYLANFTTNQMYQDLTAEEWDKPKQYSDLFIGGIPCQAFSLAGKRLGELDKRGLLFYDFYRYVKNQQPKVFIIENVKGLLSDNNGITFQNWCALLGQSMNTHLNMFNHDDSLLYNLHFKVLNSKDFGVPQNRERVFLIGIRNDLPNNFRFPIGERLKIRLKDILESEVHEKYYLSENAMEYLNKGASGGYSDRMTFLNKSENEVAGCITANHSKGIPYNMLQESSLIKTGIMDGYRQDATIYSDKGISPTLDTKCFRRPYIETEPYCVAMRGRNPENPSDRTTGTNTEQRLEPNLQGITNTITSVQKDNLIIQLNPITNGRQTYQQDRIYDINGINPVLNTHNNGFINTYRIRRLTPLECMRLQGYPDDYIKPCSDSQTYKQAGNSITVNVMKAIIKNLIPVL